LTARALDDGRLLSEAWMAEFEERCRPQWEPQELAVLNAWRTSLELEGGWPESWDDWVVASQHLQLLLSVGFVREQLLHSRL
jgi:hypothetical protein